MDQIKILSERIDQILIHILMTKKKKKKNTANLSVGFQNISFMPQFTKLLAQKI